MILHSKIGKIVLKILKMVAAECSYADLSEETYLYKYKASHMKLCFGRNEIRKKLNFSVHSVFKNFRTHTKTAAHP
jgi:hypothetical protein